MKKYLSAYVLLIFLIASAAMQAQEITFVPQDTLLVDTLGSEIIFTVFVTNISAQDQTVFLVRTLDDLPPNWQSSLCFALCFAPFVDSIVTNSDYGSTPLSPGEEREMSLHVFAVSNPGTANVQIKAGTFRNPDVTYTANLKAIVNPTSVEDNFSKVSDFSLSQNYPNPFNPTTSIQYAIGSKQFVTLKVYNMLGNEVATLVNEYKPAGNYEIQFNPESSIKYPASGIYFYRLTAGSFTQTRKMILEK